MNQITTCTQSFLQRCNDLLSWATTHRPASGEPAIFERTELSRHDHHNLEIKTLTQSGNHGIVSELDVFLLVPGSFQLPRWGKGELQSDFRSRLRLAVPVQADEGYSAVADSGRLLRETVVMIASSQTFSEDPESPLFYQLVERAKAVGAVVGETLKQLSTKHRNRFLLAHSLAGDQLECLHTLAELPNALDHVTDVIQSIRDTLSIETSPPNPVLTLLDEFISHLYVQYLGTLREAMTQLDPPAERFGGASYTNTRRRLDDHLGRLQRREAEYRRRFSQVLERAKDEADQEHQIVRLSQLKKFFQSRMFVEVSRKDPHRCISESTAALGAACASLWASFAKQFEHGTLFRASYKGLAVFSIGVIAYVLKDRVKEWTKKGFWRRASRLLPDFSQQLIAEGRAIGAIREWFQFRKAKTLPIPIRNLRLRARRSEIEGGLPEDVFHYRRQQTFAPMPTRALELHATAVASGWAIQESLRINVERYLKHMDDPFKELAVLDASGRLRRFRSHRVYDFYIGIRTAHRRPPAEGIALHRSVFASCLASQSPLRESVSLYRVILDKKGIDRVEEIGCG